ncbi:hypothetical protein O3G_MSEX008355 [Manduca sexta]|uniref:Uncharacterized protein n=1 Tax=Manduca sexta TaxID=7130 RepID=A0A922CPU7_MANSE|nr:hypothetical protein O3G_MSEX008355 [Manduca sexta]KAG6453846.1 hypothetical protein O3G_MSEX008355 [Manduca sexta]
MARRKSACVKWTLVLLCVVCPFVYSRPQDASQDSTVSSITDTTENPLRAVTQKISEEPKPVPVASAAAVPDSARDVKSKLPIRDSIKIVASQLLDKPENESANTPVADTRVPPKLKSQLSNKHKIKTRNEDGEGTYNGHAGEAVPITLDDVDTENKISDVTNESSTSNDGISTWILVSNPTNASTVSTEPTKTEEAQKKPKPPANKNKAKRPQNNKTVPKRPAVGNNKGDMMASASSINENAYTKIRDTAPTNVQKTKSTPNQRTTTMSSTEVTIPKKEVTKSQSIAKSKKKNKNKQKVTTEVPEENESALLPMEPKEQEIELEVSTPPTTTKKPKRSSSKSKNKTKKRKTSTPKPESETEITEIKTSGNKTKSAKPAKKPEQTGTITTQLYNYFSREVMPSVGVGVIGLASLVGIASYFLYPFSTPVRRTFEVDKKDDIYNYNAEEYANDGNGQAEEEMLGTVLAGMPTHAKQKLNPYAAQTPHINRYPVKKDQDLRYRHGAVYDPNYSRYPQQKTGIAHAAVYAKPVNYNPQYETRHVYTTESKYNFDKPQSYTPYPAVEPIYAAPQTGSGVSSYGNDNTNSVVYGVKPTSDSDFKPVYPYNSQFFSESTSSPVTYSPTSMYLGSNNEEQEASVESSSQSNESDENKFVVGNVPKELVDSATPAVVPEHGPRKLKKRSISSSLEEILRAEKENKDIFISNEIDDSYSVPVRNLAAVSEPLPMNDVEKPKEVIPIYAVSMDPAKEQNTESTTLKNEIIESVSTLPVSNDREKTNTATESDTEVTTKTFKVYEVFPGVSSPKVKDATKYETTTQFRNMMTETTTDIKLETTSTLPPSPSPVSDPSSPKPTQPDVITYPPLNQSGGFFTFLKRLVEFKYRLGLSILQSTSESLNRYLRSMEDTMTKVAKASRT